MTEGYPFASTVILKNALEKTLNRLLLGASSDPKSLITCLAVITNEGWLDQYLATLATCFEAVMRKVDREVVKCSTTELQMLQMIRDHGGVAMLPSVQHRNVGPYDVRFNALRAFKPMGLDNRRVTAVRQEPLTGGFNFADRRLEDEVVWEGVQSGRRTRVLINSFPALSFHLLLVPDVEELLPQLLTPDMARWSWDVFQEICEGVPNYYGGFNSIGACASVNHLHFHSFAGRPLPILSPHWRHNGGTVSFPLPFETVTSADGLCGWVERQIATDTAHNILYLKNRAFCFARLMQGSFQHEAWTPAFAFGQLAGLMVVFYQEVFANLTVAHIELELGKLAIV